MHLHEMSFRRCDGLALATPEDTANTRENRDGVIFEW